MNKLWNHENPQMIMKFDDKNILSVFYPEDEDLIYVLYEGNKLNDNMYLKIMIFNRNFEYLDKKEINVVSVKSTRNYSLYKKKGDKELILSIDDDTKYKLDKNYDIIKELIENKFYHQTELLKTGFFEHDLRITMGFISDGQSCFETKYSHSAITFYENGNEINDFMKFVKINEIRKFSGDMFIIIDKGSNNNQKYIVSFYKTSIIFFIYFDNTFIMFLYDGELYSDTKENHVFFFENEILTQHLKWKDGQTCLLSDYHFNEFTFDITLFYEKGEVFLMKNQHHRMVIYMSFIMLFKEEIIKIKDYNNDKTKRFFHINNLLPYEINEKIACILSDKGHQFIKSDDIINKIQTILKKFS